MGLILTRREGEEIWLYVEADADPEELLAQLKRGIQVRVTNIGKRHVDIAFWTPPVIRVARQELLVCPVPGQQREPGAPNALRLLPVVAS